MVYLLAQLSFFQIPHLPTRKARALVPQVLSPMGLNQVSFLISILPHALSISSRSDDESSDADSTVLKAKLVKAKINRKRKFERDSSRTLTSGDNSDASEEELPVTKETGKRRKEKEKEMKEKTQEAKESDDSKSSSSDSDSDSTSHVSKSATSSSSSESEDDASKPTKKIPKDNILTKRKMQDDSDSDTSDSDSNSKMDEDPPVNAKPPTSLKKNETNYSQAQVTKKLRTSENGASVSTATTETSRTKENGTRTVGNGQNGKNPRKSNTPFQRFDPDKLLVVVNDNRYEAKVCVDAVTSFHLKVGHACQSFWSCLPYI
jgi:hypothetical protein